MLKNREFIVFGLDHYNPLGVIRTLGEQGIRPIYIVVKHRADIGTESKYIKKCHRVNSVEEGYELLIKEYGNYDKDNLPIVITTEDRSTECLDRHFDELKDKFIFNNAGKAGRITEFMDKKNILDCAKRHGLNVLDSVTVERGVIPEGLEYPIITKSISPNVGGWKSDVHICHNEEELVEAYKSIAAPTVLIQKYIEKKNEYCLDGFAANKGKIVFNAIASTYNYVIPGYYSPYMTVTNFNDEKMQKSLEGMMEEIGFEGIYSIEFLIDQDDNYWFCEINFRNSTWSYAATVAGMPLGTLWAEAELTGKLPEQAYKPIKEGFTAMVEPIDHAKRVLEGRATVGEWLADFKNADCTFYYNEQDLEPFYAMVRNWKLFS